MTKAEQVRGTSRFYVVFGRVCSRIVLEFDGIVPHPALRTGPFGVEVWTADPGLTFVACLG